MADTTYVVSTIYNVETERGRSAIGGFTIVLDHMINLAREAKNVVGEITSKIIELSSKTEQARIAIAGMFTASGFAAAKDFNMSLEMSSAIMKKIVADAARLPGTAEDLQEIFQRAIPGGAQAGHSIMQIEEMSGKMMAVGKAFGLNASLIGQELAEMMEGRARSMTPLFSKLKSFMGDEMNAPKFNALSQPEKWERIQRALEHFNPMIDAYASTWDAVSSTTESYANQLIRIGSSGIFDFMKNKLAELNGWYEKNKDQVDAMAKKLGEDIAQRLRQTFDAVKATIEFVIAHKQSIIQIAEAFAIFKGFSMMGGGGASAVGSVAGQAGTMVAGGALGYALDQLAGNATAASSGIAVFLGSLSAMPGNLGLVSSGLLLLYESLRKIADWWDGEHKKDVEREGNIGDPRSLLPFYNERSGGIDKRAGEMMAGFLMAHGIANRDTGGINTNRLMSFLMMAADKEKLSVEEAHKFREFAFLAAAGGYVHGHAARPEDYKGGRGMLMGIGEYGVMGMTKDEEMNAALNQTGRPVTPHITNIGAINMYTNIYDSEDSARIVTHLANKMREAIEHPAKSPSASELR